MTRKAVNIDNLSGKLLQQNDGKVLVRQWLLHLLHHLQPFLLCIHNLADRTSMAVCFTNSSIPGDPSRKRKQECSESLSGVSWDEVWVEFKCLSSSSSGSYKYRY